MKFLAVLCLSVSVVVCEPPAPASYPPSGWRPNGPSFDLPRKTAQAVNQDSYFPPLQTDNQPSNEYGPPEEDVSVQGLPTSEQNPQFLVSPISGQQYVGPTFNADVRSLDQRYRQSQFQIQQDSFRELQRQRDLQERNRNINGFPVTQPRQFGEPNVQNTERTLTTTPLTESSTRSDNDYTDDNPEESIMSKATSKINQNAPQEKTTVEVAKQNVQQIPPELLLSPLTQLAANQYAYPLQQLGQLRAPIFYQPNLYSQPLIQSVGSYQSSNFDGPAHFATLQSILAQRQILLGQPQSVYQTQQGFIPAQPNVFVTREQPQSDPDAVSIDQFNPQFPNSRLQSNTQQNQPLPQSKDIDSQQTNNKTEDNGQRVTDHDQPKFIFNQPQFYQPQEIPYQYQQPLDQQSNQFVPQQQFLYNQPQVGYQPSEQGLSQYYQNQLLLQQQYAQPQLPAQNENQGQDALQSGLDINQQGNDVGTNPRKKDNDDGNPQENDDDESTATAVATAFGSRLSPPRTYTQYGAPIPNVQPRMRQGDGASNDDSGPAVAQATAVADGTKKSARLRSRRVRPIFTLDKSGHLVLAQNQQAN